MKPATLLRLYPRAWRERYGDEFLALLNQTGASPSQVMDVVRGAALERVRATIGWTLPESLHPLRVAAIPIAASIIWGTVMAILANIIAFDLHLRYGQLPSFNSTISNGIPQIAFPPAILPTLFWYAHLQRYLLPRVILSGGPIFCLSRWLRVSRVEVALWCVVILVSSTAFQLESFATAGAPGFPLYSRSEIWWDAWPECLNGCLILAMSTQRFWNRVLKARERAGSLQGNPPSAPAQPLGLG